MAEQLKLCVKGVTPVLFNLRSVKDSDRSWLENHAVISGHNDGRVDGTVFLADILRDGHKNYDEKHIVIPKQAVIQTIDGKELDITWHIRPRLVDKHGKQLLDVKEDELKYTVSLHDLLEIDEVEDIASQFSQLSSGPSDPSQQLPDHSSQGTTVVDNTGFGQITTQSDAFR